MNYDYAWKLDGVTVNFLEMLFNGDTKTIDELFGFPYTNHYFLVTNGHAQHYLNIRSRRMAERLGSQKFSQHVFVNRFLATSKKAERKVNAIIRRIHREQLSHLTSAQLRRLYDRYFNALSTLLGCYRATRPEFTSRIIARLFSLLPGTREERTTQLNLLLQARLPDAFRNLTKTWRTRVRDLARLGHRRFAMHGIWAPSLRKVCPLFAAIGNRLGFSAPNVANFTRDEISAALLGGRQISHADLASRCQYRFHYHGRRFSIGLMSKTHRAQSVQTVLKGQTAWPGKVRGRVFLINETLERSLHAVARTMPKRNVLVTVMTTPDMMIAVKRACAIVTDEGGMLSHAAIVAREFRTPTIVGTHHATKSLKNGDRVEVDATKGTVKKL